MPGEKQESSLNQEKVLQAILVVEDDEAIGDLLVQTLMSETRHPVLLVTDARQALKAIQSIKPVLFMLDYHLDGINGLELYDRLHQIKGLECVPTLMMSAQSPPRQAMSQRHIAFLKKPFDLSMLLKTTEALLTTQKRT
jgi:DNA-binding NtrC family response regulator